MIENNLNKIFIKYTENYRYVLLSKKLKSAIKKVIYVIATSFNQSSYKLYKSEAEFSEKANLKPLKIKLDTGIMNIIGKVDRIDKANINQKDYVRIIDYKSSSKDVKVKDIEQGIKLQLITYMQALLNNEDVIPAGIMYLDLSDNIISLKPNKEETLKEETLKRYRLKGIYLSDIENINAMDKYILDKEREKERLVDISKRTITTSDRLLNLEDFENLFKSVKDTLKEIGNEIYKGISEIRENENCKYCPYSSICRKKIKM